MTGQHGLRRLEAQIAGDRDRLRSLFAADGDEHCASLPSLAERAS